MDLVQFIGRFHVLVLHLPIGILLMAAVIEAYTSFKKHNRPALLDAVWLWGFVSAVGACTLGYMLSLGGGYDEDSVAVHKVWGISVAVFSLLCWWVFSRQRSYMRSLVISICGVQLFMLFTTGHYGANMTHGPTYLFEYAPNSIRALGGMGPHEPPREAVTDVADADVYQDIVKPALKQRCAGCHNPDKSKGRLDVTRFAALIEGGKSGPAIVPNDLQKSELFQRITIDSHDKKYMPADGKTPLTDQQVAAIKYWILSGAQESATVASLSLDQDAKSTLAQVLGLEASAGAWPLPAVSPLPDATRVTLESHGFLVKRIADDVNYIDVDFSSSNKALTNDALLSLVAAKDHIVWLNLADSEITDKQLEHLAKLSNLLKLRLEKNPITSAGISVLTALPQLQYLNVYQTQIDDQSFNTFAAMPELKQVYIMMTNVSQNATEDFIKQVEHKVYVESFFPPEVSEAQQSAENTST